MTIKMHTKYMRCSKSSSQREICSDTGLPLKKQEKSQVNNLTYHLKDYKKKKKTRPKVSRRKEIIKIWEEINKIEIKEIIEKNQ